MDLLARWRNHAVSDRALPDGNRSRNRAWVSDQRAGREWEVGDNPPKAPKGVLYELQKMYYDTAQQSNPVAMRALRTVAPVSQIVFGTDYPYRNTEEHVNRS